MEKNFMPVTKIRWNRELSNQDIIDNTDNYNEHNFDERLDDMDIAELERQRFAKRNLANAAFTAAELEDELDDEEEEMIRKAS